MSRRSGAMTNEEELRDKRRALEMSLANHYHLSERSKDELIKKILDVLEEAMEDDRRFDDD